MCNVSVSCHAMVGAKESLKNTKTIDLKSCFLDLHETPYPRLRGLWTEILSICH